MVSARRTCARRAATAWAVAIATASPPAPRAKSASRTVPLVNASCPKITRATPRLTARPSAAVPAPARTASAPAPSAWIRASARPKAKCAATASRRPATRSAPEPTRAVSGGCLGAAPVHTVLRGRGPRVGNRLLDSRRAWFLPRRRRRLHLGRHPLRRRDLRSRRGDWHALGALAALVTALRALRTNVAEAVW